MQAISIPFVFVSGLRGKREIKRKISGSTRSQDNIIVWLRIAGRSGWWIILLLIPIVGAVIAIVVSIDLAKKFGKGAGFGVGLALLGFIFYPILAWGSAQYSGA